MIFYASINNNKIQYIESPSSSENTNSFSFKNFLVLNEFASKTHRPSNLQANFGANNEFYLYVRAKPFSNEIEKCLIVNDGELSDLRNNYDDVLSIAIPIVRRGVYDEQFLNGTFNWSRKQYDTPLTGYKYGDNISISGAILKSPDDMIIDVFKNTLFNSEKFITLKFDGSIEYGDQYDSFTINEATITESSESEITFNPTSYTTQLGIHNFSFNFPLGKVINGNYIHFAKGNINLNINTQELEYYKELADVSGGLPNCKEAVYETKTFLYVLPEFS